MLRSTFNNIEVQSLEFVVYSLLPWLRLWEEEANRKLVSEEEQREGYYVKHVMDGLLRGDTESRAAFYKAMRELGVFSANDIAELEDRNPIGPLGDLRYISANLVPLGQEPAKEPLPKDDALPESEANDALAVIADRFGVMVAQQATLHLDLAEQLESSLPTLLPAAACEPPDNTAALVAAYDSLNDVMQRFITKEQNAARRAATSGATLFAWMDPFFEKHAAQLAEAATNPIAVVLAIESSKANPADEAREFAKAHVSKSREELLAAMECQESELAARIESTVAKWRDRRIVCNQERGGSWQFTG